MGTYIMAQSDVAIMPPWAEAGHFKSCEVGRASLELAEGQCGPFGSHLLASPISPCLPNYVHDQNDAVRQFLICFEEAFW